MDTDEEMGQCADFTLQTTAGHEYKLAQLIPLPALPSLLMSRLALEEHMAIGQN